MDYTNYHPAPHVLDHLKQVNFVAVIGPTAAGKTTLIRAAAQQSPALHMLVAGVSRPPRPGEQDGVDFHFAAKTDMQKRAGKGEYATVVVGVSGDLYTTAPENYPIGKAVLMALLADAVPEFRSLPYRSFRSIFVTPPDYETWQARIEAHGFPPDQLQRRLLEAERSLVFAANDKNVHFVINQDMAAATEDFLVIALGKPLPARLQADQLRARTVVRNLLEQLRRSLAVLSGPQ